MLTTCARPLLVLFSSHLLAFALAATFVRNVFEQGDHLWCDGKFLLEPPRSLDCLHAIKRIPGGLQIDPDGIERAGLSPGGRMTLELDRRRYQLPADFHAGDCLIHVSASSITVSGTRSSLKPAVHPNAGLCRYYHWWPRVNEAARTIVGECFERQKETMGSYEFDAVVNSWRCRLRVVVYKRPIYSEARV